MPYYRIPGVGMAHLKMTSTKRRPAPLPCCARIPHPSNAGGKAEVRCMAISSILCDWPVEGNASGTCDAPLCHFHAHAVGPDRHLCPVHWAVHRAEHAEVL